MGTLKCKVEEQREFFVRFQKGLIFYSDRAEERPNSGFNSQNQSFKTEHFQQEVDLLGMPRTHGMRTARWVYLKA